MRIAFFDSGIGGLTVFYEALHLFPNEDYIYFADSDNAPYGSRSKKEVQRLIGEAIAFLAKKDIDVLVLACHTASKLMKEKLQNEYDFRVIGMESGLEADHFQNTAKKILICGTDLSVKVWEKHFQQDSINPDYLSLQQLITLAEKRNFYSSDAFSYLYQKLTSFEWENYQAILLGCTHFPFYRRQIQDILPTSIQILDGGYATIKKLGSYIKKTNQKQNNNIQYFISGKPKPTAYFFNYLETLKLEQERLALRQNYTLLASQAIAYAPPCETVK
ncbi:MAG: glutamate racemase, partial [Saprospiraceae bacterium]